MAGVAAPLSCALFLLPPRYQGPVVSRPLLRFERRPQTQIAMAAIRRTAAPPIVIPAIAPVDNPWDDDAEGVGVGLPAMYVSVGMGVEVGVDDVAELVVIAVL